MKNVFNKKNKITLNISTLTHQNSKWLEYEPAQRLKISWEMRKRLKDLEKGKSKKIKDLSDIARLLEADTEIEDKIPNELLNK